MTPTSIAGIPGFLKYTHSYVARDPDLSRLQYADELMLLGDDQGIQELVVPPSWETLVGEPPRSASDAGRNKYLWVIVEAGVPLVLEEGDVGQALSRKRVAHSNLTGGGPAFCGGELWFRDEDSFWLSGGSSRFRPRGEAELLEIRACFSSAGYKVASFGWDGEANTPVRFLRGEAEWV